MTDIVSEKLIKDGLHTKHFGERVLFFRATSSTMDIAEGLAKQGVPEGTVVIADEQTAGRGRLKRAWSAPPGSSVLMTIVLRPTIAILGKLALAGALAVADAIEETTGLQAGLKWPNDVLINGKKVSGILVESEVKGDELEYVTMGIGVNVNFDVADLPDISYPATSLQLECGRPVSRVAIVCSLLKALELRYDDLKSGKSIYGEWARRLTIIGKPVKATSVDKVEEGIAESVDESGALIIRRADGSYARILAADVTLRE